jgi:putative membrane protein insertion efficiency factor
VIRTFAIRFIDTYQRRVAADLGTRCQFQPTCSEYGRLAFERHGALRAARMTVRRLRRCRPDYDGPLTDYP